MILVNFCFWWDIRAKIWEITKYSD